MKARWRTYVVALGMAALALLAGSMRQAAAQTIISTIPGNSRFGTGGFLVIGQTFTAPADNVLTSFALQLDNTQALTLSVFAYDEITNTTAGGPLFTSAPTSPTLVAGRNGYSFSTGELSLTTGLVYSALLSGTVNFNGPNTAAPPTPTLAASSSSATTSPARSPRGRVFSPGSRERRHAGGRVPQPHHGRARLQARRAGKGHRLVLVHRVPAPARAPTSLPSLYGATPPGKVTMPLRYRRVPVGRSAWFELPWDPEEETWLAAECARVAG